MAVVDVVAMAFDQVVHVVFVADRGVAAIRSVGVGLVVAFANVNAILLGAHAFSYARRGKTISLHTCAYSTC